VAAAEQEDAHSGERHEDRRAEADGEAREEQGGKGRAGVDRIGDRDIDEPGLADMVEQHENHDEAAQRVDERTVWWCGLLIVGSTMQDQE